MKPLPRWFKIDHAGKLFPVVTNRLRSSYFREAVQLTVMVNPQLLQQAAELTLKRYPHFKTKLTKGLFWNFLEPQDKPFMVEKEPNAFGSISTPFSFRKHLVHIYYFETRIAVEFYHVLTDGRGGMEFLKHLTFTYLVLAGFPIDPEGLFTKPEDQINEHEVEDSFSKKVKRGKEAWLPSKKAHHLQGTFYSNIGHQLTHLHFSVKEVLTITRQLNTTITGFYTSILIFLMLQDQQHEPLKNRKPILMSVPVDMRKYYPSKTMRNFVMTISVGGLYPVDTPFETILLSVTNQLKEGQSVEKLAPQIRANMKAERMLFLRFVPLFFKNLIIKYVYNKVGEPALSMTLSNLGAVTMPSSTASLIHHFEFMLSSTYLLPINLGVVSFQDHLVLSFSKLIVERTFLTRFVDFLHHHYPLQITVDGNQWEDR